MPDFEDALPEPSVDAGLAAIPLIPLSAVAAGSVAVTAQ